MGRKKDTSAYDKLLPNPGRLLGREILAGLDGIADFRYNTLEKLCTGIKMPKDRKKKKQAGEISFTQST